jgi:predicted N-acetyltransferase YhbS
MAITVRRSKPEDAEALGTICYEAFKAIAEAHNFTPDIPSGERATGLIAMLIGHPRVFDVVAEVDGRVAGSNFLDEHNIVSGVGPITVDPAAQNDGVGRALMQAVLERSAERGFAGIRLVQAGYHRRSLALYLKLGFEVREHLACLQGQPLGKTFAGYEVRQATEADLPACSRLCFRVHGFERGGELADSIAQGHASVVERGGRITAYTTGIGFFAHTVAETTDDIRALIAAAPVFAGPGVLVPSRNGELVRWCLAEGLRITQTMTLMSIGLYNEPAGVWLPSVLY